MIDLEQSPTGFAKWGKIIERMNDSESDDYKNSISFLRKIKILTVKNNCINLITYFFEEIFYFL